MNLIKFFKYATHYGLVIIFSLAGPAMAYPVTVKLLSNAEWLPEGSGVLLSTDKGYVHIYNNNMYKLGESKRGECYILEADTEDYVTLHKNKFPSLKALNSQREVSSWAKINCRPGRETWDSSKQSMSSLKSDTKSASQVSTDTYISNSDSAAIHEIIRDGFSDAASAFLDKNPTISKCATAMAEANNRDRKKNGLDERTTYAEFGEFIGSCIRKFAGRIKM